MRQTRVCQTSLETELQFELSVTKEPSTLQFGRLMTKYMVARITIEYLSKNNKSQWFPNNVIYDLEESI